MRKHNIKNLSEFLWFNIKYQLLTKVFLFFVIFPIYRTLLSIVLNLSGRTLISSGDYQQFILSVPGLLFIGLNIITLGILVAVDINAYIIMSALSIENKLHLSLRQVLWLALLRLRPLINPRGIMIMIMVALTTPLIGVGIGISFTSNFRIPNFIQEVIYSKSFYFFIYISILLCLTILYFLYLFVFHGIIVAQQPIKQALKMAHYLSRKYWKEYLRTFFDIFWRLIVLTLLGVSIFVGFVFLIMNIEQELLRRVLNLFLSVNMAEWIALVTFLIPPYIWYRLTLLYYQLIKQERVEFDFYPLSQQVRSKSYFGIFPRLILLIASVIVLLGNLIFAVLSGIFFEEFFLTKTQLEIVAHRAGGDAAAENSLLGLEKAIELGAQWSEIDIQRTEDNHYIIQHDKTFARVSGVAKASQEMTLAEIKQLKIKDLFNKEREAQPVATLTEFLDTGKNRIKLMLELKGVTADEKMVDDVVALVKERKMEDQVALISLDYALIKLIESKYPEITTGYLYFFSIGTDTEIVADMYLLEEQLATPDRIERIEKLGKQAIVWTVNQGEDLPRLIDADVKGVITDRIQLIKDELLARDQRSDLQIIIDAIISD